MINAGGMLVCAHRQYSMVGTVTYYDDDDDDDSMCRNLCNQTWSIRVCDDPGIECIRWNAMHAVAATVFIVGSIVFGLAALSPKVQLEPGRTGMGILKTMLCMSAVICLVGFAITLSYTVTESVSVYTRQIDVLFGLAMSVLLAWAGGLCALRVKGKRVAWRDGYAPLTVQ